MTQYMKLLTVVFSILLLTSFKKKEEVYIWYPRTIAVVQDCNGQEVELVVAITTESLKKISVHSFSLHESDFTIYKNNEVFSASDTLTLSKNSPLTLKVKYTLQSSNKPETFAFKTNIDAYSNNQIKLGYGQYSISANDIKDGKEQTINVTESCRDSIKVFFPYGGTISGATLYSDSTRSTREFKSVSYEMMQEGNYLTFTKADVGRYFVDYGSCHWGGEFWLTIK